MRDYELGDLPQQQSGVVSRQQALGRGLSVSTIREHVATGRWQRVHRGVYAMFSGPLQRPSLLWAAVLVAGPGAMLSHETAAELHGLGPQSGSAIQVTVPHERMPTRVAGVVLHRCTRAAAIAHPTRLPPQTRIDDTIADLTQTAATIDDAMSWLARAVGGRFTTATRLSDCIRSRPKLRWRTPLREALGDIEAGCHSVLELAYLRLVERAHQLPRSKRQVRRADGRYDDVRYPGYATRVELDGLANHAYQRLRDMDRDNAASAEGDRVLRYGWGVIVDKPCAAAEQLTAVLRAGGWPGSPRRCRRPDCSIPS